MPLNRLERGFTLIEVMVALAVVAVALPALLMTLSQQLDSVRYLEDRSHAQWVAANRLAELRLVSQARGSLQAGLIAGEEELAGRKWYWWSDGRTWCTDTSSWSIGYQPVDGYWWNATTTCTKNV